MKRAMRQQYESLTYSHSTYLARTSQVQEFMVPNSGFYHTVYNIQSELHDILHQSRDLATPVDGQDPADESLLSNFVACLSLPASIIPSFSNLCDDRGTNSPRTCLHLPFSRFNLTGKKTPRHRRDTFRILMGRNKRSRSFLGTSRSGLRARA